MEQKMVKGTQRQLRGLADNLAGAGDEQAAVLMAQTGASLMANCARLSGTVLGSMSESSFSDTMDACGLMARKTAELMNHPRCAPIAAQMQQIDQMRQFIEMTARSGEDARRRIARMRSEAAAAEEENRQLAGEADALRTRCDEARTRAQRLAGQREELERQWNALEPELRQRVDETCALEQKLERIRTRGQDFSPEHQAQLRGEIDALSQQMAQDQRAVEGLNETLAQLREDQAALSEQRDGLESDALDRIRAALSRLGAASSRQHEQLAQVQRTVDTIDERLAQCRSLQSDYASWLDANNATMDELARILGENDPLNGSLRETLDPAQTAKLRRLRDSAEENLRQMDALLTPCIRLMSSNRRAVLGKVTQGPAGKGSGK